MIAGAQPGFHLWWGNETSKEGCSYPPENSALYHGNATFWYIFIRCGTEFKSVTRVMYIRVNIEGPLTF